MFYTLHITSYTIFTPTCLSRACFVRSIQKLYPGNFFAIKISSITFLKKLPRYKINTKKNGVQKCLVLSAHLSFNLTFFLYIMYVQSHLDTLKGTNKGLYVLLDFIIKYRSKD